VGVNGDKIAHIFEAFSQVQEGQVTGTGLGLFGVRTRAEGLPGTCGARHNTASSTGTGTVFWFAIPYIPDHHARDLVPSSPMAAPQSLP
jgi:signal transduction histidine kinase